MRYNAILDRGNWDLLDDETRAEWIARALVLPSPRVWVVTDSNEEVDLGSVWVDLGDVADPDRDWIPIGEVTTEGDRVVVDIDEADALETSRVAAERIIELLNGRDLRFNADDIQARFGLVADAEPPAPYGDSTYIPLWGGAGIAWDEATDRFTVVNWVGEEEGS